MPIAGRNRRTGRIWSSGAMPKPARVWRSRSNVLVIEVTFLNRDIAKARDYGHLTAAEAAPLAAVGRREAASS